MVPFEKVPSNVRAGVWCHDLHSAANCDGYVTEVHDGRLFVAAGEHEVARLDLIDGDRRTDEHLLLRGPRQRDASLGVGPLDEAGTVKADRG